MHDLIAEARRAGWDITRTTGGHLRWRSPEGRVVFTEPTPSQNWPLTTAMKRTENDAREALPAGRRT
jgi:predicted RNA binding protein YcfA (HicA-like mRNA interferase family)